MPVKPLVGLHAIGISFHGKYHVAQVTKLVQVGYSDDTGN